MSASRTEGYETISSMKYIGFLSPLRDDPRDDERGSCDVYYLEQEWREWWVESGMPEPGFSSKAFVAFCKKRYERDPNP